jgi:hypothetical protein
MGGLSMADTGISKTEYIYDPVDQFQKVYQGRHHTNTNDYFDSLLNKSQVDQTLNRTTVKQIKKLQSESTEHATRIKNYSTYKLLAILSTLSTIGLLIYSIQYMLENEFTIWYLLLAVLGLGLSIYFIYIIRTKIIPKIKELKHKKGDSDAAKRELINQCWQQLAPLNSLFTHSISSELFRQTIPLIKLDNMFDSKRLDYLIHKFGFVPTDDKNRSTVYVQSGEINGNPLYICKELSHHMGTKVYSGSKTIRWTTTKRVNGKRVTQHHSQILTATIQKPFPHYMEQSYVVYGNEAAPDLIFYRQDSDAENMTQKEIDKQVQKDIKKLNKLSENSYAKGSNYTVMGNSEFEVLFDTKNRNNEVQFRLLFTPLAQQQLLKLMKDKDIGFGDDFRFIKRQMMNFVYPDHLKQIHLNMTPDFFKGYDIDAMRERFITYNEAYFKHIYFAIAPLLCIPLYQQQKPHEYIYKDYYNSYVSFYEHEKIVNTMNVNEFKHPLSTTRNILKTSVVTSGDLRDTIKVTAHGYQTIGRTDYVSRFGRDGRSHSIPVQWIEYIPVRKESDVDIHIIPDPSDESSADRFRTLIEELKHRNVSEENIFRLSSFIAHKLQ